MQPNNLTALDFNDIKASIKSYLRTRKEFTDYDFDGAALSYLIDLLAYNTYYTSFNANMALNECFLPSATIRDNVVNISKILNYTPKSIIASRGYINIECPTTMVNGSYPSTITLNKGPVATGGNFVWSTLNNVTVNVNQTTGIGLFKCLDIREGNIVKFSYVVNTFANQIYKIPSEDADISTLTVRVKPNESSTTSDVYNQVDNVTGLTPTTRVYFLSEGEDMRYEVKFGDDSIGRKLKDGEVIELEYLVTSGADANDVQKFAFTSALRDNNGNGYTQSTISVTTMDKSQLGAPAESVESIKYNAPRYYSAQYRAVTAQDYAIITKNIYDNADAVVAYGGDSLNPPVYGKVYVAIKTKTGSDLNDATKKEVAAKLRDYSMASIDPVVVDVDNVYIYLKVFAQYDTGQGNASDIKANIQKAIGDWASQTQINNFNSTFRLQQFEKALTLSDKSIGDVSSQVSILKYIKPSTNQTNTYCLSTGSSLYNSAPSQDGGDGVCKKEPILLSGTFRTADRPGVDQQFEDDGYGLLRVFYNTGTRKVYTNNAAGSVDYDTGKVCFGPVNVIGAGGNLPPTGSTTVTDPSTGTGSVTDPTGLPTDLQIPVNLIPANNSTIPASTPGTIINIIAPEVTVAALGSTSPATIPLNSLTPTTFNQTPSTVEVAPIQNAGAVNTSSCF